MTKNFWLLFCTVLVVSVLCVSCDPKFDDLDGFVVTYSGGPGAGGNGFKAKVEDGRVAALAGNPFFKKGYRFAGWEYGASTLQPYVGTITVTGDMTLTATWDKVTDPLYLIEGRESSFDGGGNTVRVITQKDGEGNTRSILAQSFPADGYTYGAFIGTFSPTIDIRLYNKIHLSVYIPDPERISFFTVEFNSSGTLDTDEIAWGDYKTIKSGWNDLVFDISTGDLGPYGGPADKSKIIQTRICVLRSAGAGEFQIADFYVFK